MKQLKGYEIRQMWLDFWESKGHKVMPGASLIPQNDPTLLWINAGVASLKKYFDGREIPENRRIANVQKSIRTNDIENVGKTARHHTFFEMLGNFSIGDYFKDDAIKWATEILCEEKWFGLDKEKLYITYYPDDVSTYNLWIKYGISKNHLIPIKDNFWEIGEGPCGPDTEIFYDRGEKYDANHIGIKLLEQDIENDRYIEIWNIVLSQFNSKQGVKRSQYKELPSKNIDTGSGLERLACIMQGAETNYETDLFLPIIKKIEEITGVKYNGQMAFKVISDHIRSTVFAISDGAVFSNEGRGYVLRRILRRAERYGKVLGMNEPFLYNLVDTCIDNMKVFYPYLVGKSDLVKQLIKQEEEKFLKTLVSGEKRLLNIIKNSDTKVISGSDAFLLYDTFGFPIELTADVALEKGFTVDKIGFTKKLNAQKARARKARGNKQSMNGQNSAFLAFDKMAKFVGYDELSITSSVIAIFKEDKQIDRGNGKLLVVFEKTPFYGEMGGEIGDRGSIILNGVTYEVTDSIMLPNKSSASVVEMDDEELSVGDIVECVVDAKIRLDIQRNHSATHLLNEALREVVGLHVHQQGSNVTDKLLRFDFNNLNSLTETELFQIENIVNDKINQNIAVKTYELPIEEAKKLGAQAMFGEKYGKIVR
ncbi:MAG: alanine--tRNA ligase, partial [Bacilli bacterium]